MECRASENSSAVEALIRNHQLPEARAALRQQLEADPRDPGLWNLLGVVNAQENKMPEAVEAFRNALRLAPRLEATWLNLGRLYMLHGSENDAPARALDAYETVLRIDPSNAEAHHQLALLFNWKGKFRESLDQLNLLPEQDRTRRAALGLRCAAEAALGDTGPALRAAEALLKDPDLEESDVVAFLSPVEGRNDEVVVRLLEGLQARRLATNETLPRLAAAYERRGNLDAARSTYDLSFRNSPVNASLLLELSHVAWKQKDYEGALGYLAHARDLEPANASVHFLFGLTANEMRIPVEARKSLEKALELAPDNPYYNYAMGAVLLQWSEKAQAIPYLKKFLTLRPGDGRGSLALATAYYCVLDYDHAKSELKPLLGSPQTRPGAEYLLGLIAGREDDLAAAAAHFRELISLEPKAPEAHAELAFTLLEQNDLEGARREADAALALDNDNYQANRTLLKIFQLSGDKRVKEQTARLQKLIAKNEAGARLLERTIEVRPW